MSDRAPSNVPTGPQEPNHRASGGRELAVVVLVGAVLLAGLGWWAWPGRTRRPTARLITVAGTPLPDRSPFIGSASCRECHPGEHAGHLGSGHARTLRRAERVELARWLDGRRVDDPEDPDTAWSYRLDQGRLNAERREGGEKRSRTTLDIALGSGTHAITFLSLLPQDSGPPEGLEHRLTYFAHLQAMGLTPGQEAGHDDEPGRTADGFQLTPAILLDCLECHGTRTAPPRDGGIALETLLPHVDCERCHGPSRRHVELARQGIKDSRALALAFGPERWTSAGQMRLCGHCHRLPSMVPPETIRPDNPALARFPSVGLLQSACYLRSEGALNCTTCHDPHARATSAANPYEAACLECHGDGEPGPAVVTHGPASGLACPVEPRSGCVNCHMPRRDVGHGLRFSDHWIRTEPPVENDPP